MSPKDRATTYLSLVEACDDFPYGSTAKSDTYYRLYLADDDHPYGLMTPEVVNKMPWTSAFAIHHEAPRSVTVLDSSNGRNPAAAINSAFAELVSICIDRDLFHVLCRQHSELTAIIGAQYPTPIVVERFAAGLFGLVSRGAHLVAYVNADDGLKVWVSRRSAHLYTYPGLLDVTVGGGIKSGVSPLETIVQEADEEASLPEDVIRQHIRPRGVLSHMNTTGNDFKGEKGLVVPDYIYVYDIELPRGVIPRPHDDEVEGFYCLSVPELQAALLNKEFKTDSAAVLVYFLIVHGFITAENEPDYVEINMRLHRMLPFRTKAL
ncbi:NUDIX hydrolase domain-like protein [Cercophora scortea]|uniref:NUDIX hydrolase domain-like protein n=1 Tax=Cercophora scortea TaxID=314031 RepID=A0AAE0I7N3_9PEZI|nr:NUDIX hydrolase domain-like protein [Cercophora scortea]